MYIIWITPSLYQIKRFTFAENKPMLPLPIIEMIRKKSGLDFNNAKDFEVLSESFPPSDRLGVNTLKRLMGYAKSPIAPRKTTLDALAHYLDAPSWEAIIGIQPTESDWVEKAFFADEIREGSFVEASWFPDRHLVLQCIGENRFRVTQSLNGKLQPNDEVVIHSFRLQYPLQVLQVVRNGEIVCDAAGNELGYIAGRQNGLTELFIKESS